MKRIVPDYYREFACLKGDCRHSCCIGWEIDIDGASLEYFRSVPGEMGARLAANISEGEGCAFFRLTEEERCPFLNREGLCDLILELGEESLCQICDDHPRFRNFFSDREEMGLGMCCEAAGKLILGREEPVRFVVLEDDGTDEALSEDEEYLLDLRGELFSIAQNRSLALDVRLTRMLDAAQVELEEPCWVHWSEFLLGLERLDDAWTRRLERLSPAQTDFAPWEAAFEQLLVCLLWRHLPGALEDGELAARVAFAAFTLHLVRALFAASEKQDLDELIEICRLYSSEIEYSDENVEAILAELHRLNPEL